MFNQESYLGNDDICAQFFSNAQEVLDDILDIQPAFGRQKDLCSTKINNLCPDLTTFKPKNKPLSFNFEVTEFPVYKATCKEPMSPNLNLLRPLESTTSDR